MQLVAPRLNARLIAYGNGTHCVYLIYIHIYGILYTCIHFEIEISTLTSVGGKFSRKSSCVVMYGLPHRNGASSEGAGADTCACVCVCEIHVALTIDQDAARRKSIMYGDGEGVQRNKREKLQSEIIAGAELHEKSLRKIKFHIFFMLSTPSAVAASAASHTAHRVGIRFEVVSADVAVVDGSCCCCCCYHKHE